MRSREAALLLLLLPLLYSCATEREKGRGPAALGTAYEAGRGLVAVPATLKVLQDRPVPESAAASIELSAARGEAESAQLLFYAGAGDEKGLRLAATDLQGPGGALRPDIGVVAYVPVRKPSLVGFHRRGAYPDPILPETEFAVRAGANQSLWYTIRVPASAEPGDYAGSVSAIDREGRSWSIPVRLRVYDVDLPKTSFLKTSINFRRENVRDERYYGKGWTAELEGRLPFLGLAHRFTARVDLPLLAVFSRSDDGSLVADWSDFDARARYWMDQGITCFELKLPIHWSMGPERIHEEFGALLESINAHIVERAWVELFYFYFYDEPSAGEMAAMGERLDAIKSHAPAIRNILTYGTTKAGERKLLGKVGIWVANLHQFDPAFARRRREAGEEAWAYAAVGNAFRGFPDNYRIDWYGTAHRALGWWLFKNGAQGFLYWAVDLWRRNPWETAESFPWTNGDGVLFYPARDGTSPPYSSIRAQLMRDAFEDYDLLTLLRRAYEGAEEIPDEARDLLEAKALIAGRSAFSTDDALYIACHARILEFLEAKRRGSPPPTPPH